MCPHSGAQCNMIQIRSKFMDRQSRYTAPPSDAASRGSHISSRRLRRTGADHFGVVCMILLLACSLLLDIRLFTLNMLPMKYLLLLMAGLLILNAVNVIVQIPTRRKKTGKLICGFISLLLSGLMIYSVVAVDSVQSAISKIAGKLHSRLSRSQ